MHDRTEWKRGEPGPRKFGKKTYVNLVEFSRPCATCGKPFSIHVTAKIANGGADSNSFGLKNCPEHRRGGPKDTTELDQLRMANNVMRQELEGLYARDKELFAENQVLKARLVVYEHGAVAVGAGANLAEWPGGVSMLTFPWDAQ